MDDFYGPYDRMSMDASLAGPEPVEGFRAFKERRSPVLGPRRPCRSPAASDPALPGPALPGGGLAAFWRHS